MTVRPGELESVTIEVPAGVFGCPKGCVALRLIDLLERNGTLDEAGIGELGGHGIYRRPPPGLGQLGLDGAMLHCEAETCEAVGTIGIGEDGHVTGIDPLLGMADFAGSPSGMGPTLISMLETLSPPPIPGA